MTTKFPAELDQFDNPQPGTSQNVVRTHSQQHSDANDAVEAVQRKIGVDGSDDPDSLDHKVRAIGGVTERLDTAAFEPVESFATSAQGHLADSAVQPATLAASEQALNNRITDTDQALNNRITGTTATLNTRIDTVAAGQSSNAIYASTWSRLSSQTGSLVGQGAFVTSDTGTHVDPVSGATVSNSGQFRWTGAAWEWLRADLLVEKSDYSQVDLQLEIVGTTLNGSSSGSSFFKGFVPGSSGVINLHFSAGAIGLRDRRGGVSLHREVSIPADTFYAVGPGQILVWDFSTNQFAVQNNFATRPSSYALMAYNKFGQIVSGLLLDVMQRMADDLRECQLVVSPWYTDGIISSGVTPMTVDLSTSALFLVAASGKQLQNLAAGTYPDKFNVAANSVLLWDLVQNVVAVYSNNAVKPMPHVLLTNCRTGGYGTTGHLVEARNSFNAIGDHSTVSQLNSRTKIQFSHITFSRDSSMASPVSVDGARVTATGLTMFAIGWNGSNVKQISPGTTGAITTVWDFADNEVLIWDWDTNTARKIGNNAARPSQFVTLLMRKNGAFVAGEMLGLVTDYRIPPFALGDSKADSTESRCITVRGKFSAQGLTVVRDRIWSFDAAPADHSAPAPVVRYWADLEGGFAPAGGLTHNFGHVATADYNQRNDVLLMGNGESATTVLPRLDLLLGASGYSDGAFLDFNNPVITPRVSIEFFVRDGAGAVVKEIGGSGAVACWGDADHIIYMMTGQGTYAHRIFKIVLGMGANDFSDSTGTSLQRWGTFIEGKADSEYNGTALVYQVYTGKEYNISQGMCFHDGKLFYGITSTSQALEVIEVSMRENGTFRTDRKFRYDAIKKDGTRNVIETEDCCIFAGRYLLAGGRHDGEYWWCLFPLYNEMGGVADVGADVAFPFPCNQVPQPMISAVGGAPDLRIESLNRQGFKVTSVAGGAGKYHWTARIP